MVESIYTSFELPFTVPTVSLKLASRYDNGKGTLRQLSVSKASLLHVAPLEHPALGNGWQEWCDLIASWCLPSGKKPHDVQVIRKS